LERQVDATMSRRPVAEVLAELDTLDGRILAHLRGLRPLPSGTVPGTRPQRRLATVPERGWTAG
jgi:hypothetical protein